MSKDLGHWTIPKGEVEAGDDLLGTARREFAEETGIEPPAMAEAEYVALGWIRQKGGKIVHAWAFPGQLPEGYRVRSNTFTMEWPPNSGRMQEFPEVDRVEFFPMSEARRRIKETQVPLLEALERWLEGSRGGVGGQGGGKPVASGPG